LDDLRLSGRAWPASGRSACRAAEILTDLLRRIDYGLYMAC
jgi:hypothetical protein